MKKVNFIMPLSPEKQYAIQRWFWVTFFLVLCTVIVAGYFVIPQLLIYRTLKKEVDALREKTGTHAASVKNKEILTKEHDTLRNRTKKIEHYNDAPKNPHQYIAAIMQACGDGAVLESIKLNKKDCEITLVCPTSEHATVCIKRLSASELFTNVKLASLQQDTQTKQLRCVIKGKVR